MLSIIILAIVFILIAVRKIGKFNLQIWQIMLFLFGMFVIGSALEKSGYLIEISNKFFSKAKSVNQLLLLILFLMGFLSAILMNDTIAIIGTPIMLLLSKKYGVEPKLLLLSLAFAVTIGEN